MAKRKIYMFNGDSLPDTIINDGTEVAITGIFLYYRPRAMFCKCGYCLDCTDRRESNPSFEGFKCPECGTVHGAKSIMTGFNYVGSSSGYQKLDYSVRKNEIKKTTITYKLVETGECLYSLEKQSDVVEYFPLSKLCERWVTRSFKKKLIDQYGDKLHPMLKVVIEAELQSNSHYAANYYSRLDQVQDIMDNNPALLLSLLEAFRNYPDVKYADFENMYPEYLLPLTAQLIKDYNPMEERSRTYSKPYNWRPASAYANYEALTCVVAYYKSGHISHHVMRNILDRPEAFKNPTFIPAFKTNYLQFTNFLDDLANDGKPLASTIFDIKAYYSNKSKKFFLDQGYSTEQFQTALDSTKHGQFGLDFLNGIGKLRRKINK